MSHISERLMRGEYISKAECAEHADEIGRTLAAYPDAMTAMEAHARLIQACTCEYDGDARDDGTPYVYRIPKAGCPVHTEEDTE